MAVIHDANLDKSTGSEGVPDGSSQKEQTVSAMKTLLEVKALKMLDRELRNEEEKPKVEAGDNLAATIVKAAQETTAKATEYYQRLAERNDDAAQKARESAEKTRIEMNAIVAQQIGGAIERLEKLQDEVKKGNTPSNFIEQFKAFRELQGVVSPPQSAATTVGDASLTMQLEQMRQNHEAAMRKFDVELAKMNQDLQIRLMEFQENRKDKEREYEDSKARRQDAFSTVGDIVAAATAGFKDKIAGSGKVSSEVPHPKSEIVPGFNCKDCGTPIAVPEGAKEVVCPNEQCGTIYSIVPGS